MKTKIVYVFEDLEGSYIKICKDRKSALKWEKENKDKIDEPIFLMKREITAKRWKQLFETEDV